MINYFFNSRIKLNSEAIRLIIIIGLILSFGLVVLYSISFEKAYKHFIHILVACFVGIFILSLNPNIVHKSSYMFYVVTVLLLLSISVFGVKAMGAKRWISMFGFKFQPSEPTKVAIVLALSRYLDSLTYAKSIKTKHLFIVMLIILIPAFLVIKQPDLGTGMIILLVSGMMLFSFGLNIRYFVCGFLCVLLAIPLIWSHMHDYQKKRIEIFLDPEEDKLGSGYNIIQSKIAVGSGGFFGKGIRSATQTKLSFIPENHTDFVFACISEEFGFIGNIALIALYSIVMLMNINIALKVNNMFHKMFIIGINSIFFCHMCINISMVIGLVPVVGVPLPLISSGGAILISMISGFSTIINFYCTKKLYKQT